MLEDCAAIVLAGGGSRRMGRNKCLLPWAGKPIIQHIVETLASRFPQVLISSRTPEAYAFLDCPVVPDRLPDRGPLMGICSVMESHPHAAYFVCAGDIPEFPTALLDRLEQGLGVHAGIYPVTANGRAEPLFALYRRTLLPYIQRCLAIGPAPARSLLRHEEVVALEVPDLALLNLNTPEAYQAAHANAIPQSHVATRKKATP